MILCYTNSTLPFVAPNPGNNISWVSNCICLHCEIKVQESRGVYYSGSNTRRHLRQMLTSRRIHFEYVLRLEELCTLHTFPFLKIRQMWSSYAGVGATTNTAMVDDLRRMRGAQDIISYHIILGTKIFREGYTFKGLLLGEWANHSFILTLDILSFCQSGLSICWLVSL